MPIAQKLSIALTVLSLNNRPPHPAPLLPAEREEEREKKWRQCQVAPRRFFRQHFNGKREQYAGVRQCRRGCL